MAKVLVADGTVESEEPSKVKTGMFNTPKPYSLTADLSDATDVATDVCIEGNPIILEDSQIPQTKGSEQGNPNGGATSGTNGAGSYPMDVPDRSVYIKGKKLVTDEEKWGMDGNDVDSCNTTGSVSSGTHVEIGEWNPPPAKEDHSCQFDLSEYLKYEPALDWAPYEIWTKGDNPKLIWQGRLNKDGKTARVYTDEKQEMELVVGHSGHHLATQTPNEDEEEAGG